MIPIFDRCHPIRVTRADHGFGLGRMTGKSNSETGIALFMQIFPQQTHLFGSASESVNKQAGRLCRIAKKEKRLCRFDDLRHIWNYRLSVAHLYTSSRCSSICTANRASRQPPAAQSTSTISNHAASPTSAHWPTPAWRNKATPPCPPQIRRFTVCMFIHGFHCRIWGGVEMKTISGAMSARLFCVSHEKPDRSPARHD